jgi:hypothetical protein
MSPVHTAGQVEKDLSSATPEYHTTAFLDSKKNSRVYSNVVGYLVYRAAIPAVGG